MNYIKSYNNASVIYTENLSRATNREMPRLAIQVIDDYAFQREFSLQYRHRSGDSNNLYWCWSNYQHPGRRAQGEVSTAVAEKFINRFHELVNGHYDYSSLLFNEDSPSNKGFVHFSERLFLCEELSVRLLP